MDSLQKQGRIFYAYIAKLRVDTVFNANIRLVLERFMSNVQQANNSLPTGKI